MFRSPTSNITAKRLFLSLLATAVLCFMVPAAGAKSAQKGPRTAKTITSPPAFTYVEAAVKKYYEKLPGFDPRGIITASQTAPVFNLLQRAGWNVSKKDRRALLDRVLPDDSFLAKQLGTPAGKKFAAQIYKYPGGYDRLDRLGYMPQGRDTLSRLIRGPDGYKMVEYMTTAPGGKNMDRMLSDAPAGKNFNKPTGRIYTLEMLLKELGKLYKNTFEVYPRPSVANESYPIQPRFSSCSNS